MTTYLGRTVQKWIKVQIADVNNTMRDIPIDAPASFGIGYDEVDVSAIQDAIKKKLSGQGTFEWTITGPFDTTTPVGASASGEPAAAHMSGSHPVLSALNGGTTPRALGIYIGIQHDWTTGGTEPVFGASEIVNVTDYKVDGAKYSAKIVYAGTATNVPAWGVTAITST